MNSENGKGLADLDLNKELILISVPSVSWKK
jgi:hypothetical protein